MRVTNHSTTTPFKPVELSTIQTRAYEFGKTDSLSKEKSTGCWVSTKSFISTIFSKIWAGIRWLFCGCCSSSIDPIDLSQILKAPKKKAEEFAQKPAEYYGALLKELSNDPKEGLKVLKNSSNARSFADFRKAFRKELGTEDFDQLRYGEDDIKLAIQVGLGDLTESKLTGDDTKYKQFKEILDGLPGNAATIAQKLNDKLAKYIDKYCSDSDDADVKALKELFETTIPAAMEDFKKKLNNSSHLENWENGIFQPLALVNKMTENLKEIFIELCEEKSSLFGKFLETANNIDEGLGKFNPSKLEEMIKALVIKEINKNITPELLNFLGDDHPLLSEKLKALDEFAANAKPNDFKKMADLMRVLENKTGIRT